MTPADLAALLAEVGELRAERERLLRVVEAARYRDGGLKRLRKALAALDTAAPSGKETA